MKKYIVTEKLFNRMVSERDRLKEALDADVKIVLDENENPTMTNEELDKKTLSPLDFSFMSGRLNELDRLINTIRICSK